MSTSIIPLVFALGVNGTVANGGGYNAGTSALWKAPSGANGGGVTITEAQFISRGGTVGTALLIDMGTAGTAPTGTVCSFPGTAAANVPAVGTPANYFLGAGHYLGLVTGAGTLLGPGVVSINMLQGRANA